MVTICAHNKTIEDLANTTRRRRGGENGVVTVIGGLQLVAILASWLTLQNTCTPAREFDTDTFHRGRYYVSHDKQFQMYQPMEN